MTTTHRRTRQCAPLLVLALTLAACGGDVIRGAGGGGGSGAGAGGDGAGGDPPPPEGCTCPDGGGFGCGPDMQCVEVDCGDGVIRYCQGPIETPPPQPECAEGEIDFGSECPDTVDCHQATNTPLVGWCAEPVPCTEAGDPVGACAEPGDTCSSALAGCPIPVRVCGDDHVWVDGAPITDC